MPLLNKEQIKEIIPHRDPFLLIDEVLELEPGVRAVATKYLRPDEDWFRGHFPENKGKLAFFAGIDKARFRGQVLPGDTLRLEMEMIKNRGSVGIGKAVAYVGDKRVVTAELTFALSK